MAELRGGETPEEQKSAADERSLGQEEDSPSLAAPADKPAEALGVGEASCPDENQTAALGSGEEPTAHAPEIEAILGSPGPQTPAASADLTVNPRRSSRLQAHQAAAKSNEGRGRSRKASGPDESGTGTSKAGRGSKGQGKQKERKKGKRKRKAPDPEDIDVTTSHDLKAVMDQWRQTYSSVQPKQSEGQSEGEAVGGGKSTEKASGASKTVRWVEDVKQQ